MRFGDYLREKREEKGWTQPEAAARAEIEQSYLSKLETGRSTPSSDVFARLVEAYEIDVDDMTRQVASVDLEKLREIAQVRAAVRERMANQRRFARGWLAAGLAFLMLGGACLGLSRVELDLDGAQYSYMSMGALGEEWPLRAYDLLDEELHPSQPDYQTMFQFQQRLVREIDPEYRTFNAFRGDWFVEQLGEGRRYYELIDNHGIDPAQPLRWFLVPALMFLIAAPACFFISFRWG